MRQFYNTCNFGLQQFSFTEIPRLLLYFRKMRQGFYSECFLKKDIYLTWLPRGIIVLYLSAQLAVQLFTT